MGIGNFLEEWSGKGSTLTGIADSQCEENYFRPIIHEFFCRSSYSYAVRQIMVDSTDVFLSTFAFVWHQIQHLFQFRIEISDLTQSNTHTHKHFFRSKINEVSKWNNAISFIHFKNRSLSPNKFKIHAAKKSIIWYVFNVATPINDNETYPHMMLVYRTLNRCCRVVVTGRYYRLGKKFRSTDENDWKFQPCFSFVDKFLSGNIFKWKYLLALT